MDTGIDVTHPDLQGVLYNFEENLPAERYAELQAKYGLGPYGINTTGDTTPDDVTSYDDHGVHVAGIVAAQWDGAGTSGVANGVKVFAVRVFVKNRMTMSAFGFAGRRTSRDHKVRPSGPLVDQRVGPCGPMCGALLSTVPIRLPIRASQIAYGPAS